MKIFDSHAHYDDEKFDVDREDVLKTIQSAGVEKVISAGYSLESSKESIQLAEKHEFVYATCGISPNDIPENAEQLEYELEELEKLIIENMQKETSNIKKTKIVAIGEIGLDYYWNKENKELQKQAFIKQIELANKYNLPIVIHTREAIDDTIHIIKNIVSANKKGVFHCCPLNIELVKQALKMGYNISFAGPITFRNSKNSSEIIKLVPMDKILIETDSPYLAPEPKRGTRNDSSNLKYIIEKIANEKQISLEEVAQITYNNATKLFEIQNLTSM